jgi:2-polyprenyl-3-methyl-5-hydroxy-6-metoxy-1,4-benzoquinol methylase
MAMNQEEATRFPFGANWQDYLQSASEQSYAFARQDIEIWLGPDTVRGKKVLDIGSGSGIHSFAFHMLGAALVVSFDYDENSVAATRSLWQAACEPTNWIVAQGSVLSSDFLSQISNGKKFDIVYSWGVLHHTGAMWHALANTCELVCNGGLLWIALYAKGARYKEILAMKEKYNHGSRMTKRIMEYRHIARLIIGRTKCFLSDLARARFHQLQSPLAWNRRKARGMDVYHDIVDWLGGLPYEEASIAEVIAFTRHRRFILEKIQPSPEGGNHIFLLSRWDDLPDSKVYEAYSE